MSTCLAEDSGASTLPSTNKSARHSGKGWPLSRGRGDPSGRCRDDATAAPSTSFGSLSWNPLMSERSLPPLFAPWVEPLGREPRAYQEPRRHPTGHRKTLSGPKYSKRKGHRTGSVALLRRLLRAHVCPRLSADRCATEQWMRY